jgi:hypothetical protein
MRLSGIGWIAATAKFYRARNLEHDMRKFHSVEALCGDGLRLELKALFDRLAIDPRSELFVRPDGMVQSGPNPKSETAPVENIAPKRVEELNRSIG